MSLVNSRNPGEGRKESCETRTSVSFVWFALWPTCPVRDGFFIFFTQQERGFNVNVIYMYSFSNDRKFASFF